MIMQTYVISTTIILTGAIGAICMYMFRHRRKSDDANDRL